MIGAFDVVLISTFPGADRYVQTVFECNDPDALPRAIDAARSYGAEHEAYGALCRLRIIPGGYKGSWGQSEGSARSRACSPQELIAGAHLCCRSFVAGGTCQNPSEEGQPERGVAAPGGLPLIRRGLKFPIGQNRAECGPCDAR